MSLKQHIPALRYGFKLSVDEMEGALGLPFVSNIWYVDPSGGSDSSGGQSQSDAFATVSAALSATTANQHDVVLIVPTGGTGRSAETDAIAWSKRFTHLIGCSAPTAQDTRAGLSFGTGGSITFSENGCLVKNITFNGTTDINVPVTVSGSYNSFLGVDFKGSLNATTGDDTASRALYVNGGQENYFGGCTLGADTFNRSAANTTLELAGAASRNVWEDCRFIMAVDAATPVHVTLTGATAIDRWIEFKNTSFYSFSANDGTAATACMDLSAQSSTGHVLLTGNTCMMGGITDWEATASARLYMQPFTATTTAIGIAVNPT